MKAQLLFAVLLLMLFPDLTFAEALPGTVETARAVKAIYDKGFILPQVVDIDFGGPIGSTISCAMVIYERTPNTICPNDLMVGPNLDKGYAVCFKPSTKEVETVTEIKTPDCE